MRQSESLMDLRERFVNQPALISPQLADRLRNYVEHGVPAELVSEYQAAAAQAFDMQYAGDRPYPLLGNLAVIRITGSLYHRMSFGFSWATGYDYITRATKAAEADPDVAGIVYDINSGGGQVDGAFEAADVIRSVSKPTRAIINSHAYSAAYLLASAADSRVIARSGGAGSIGVVTMHVDASKAVEQMGYKITFIHAGEHKVDGNRFEPLSAEVKARYQARIDAAYDMFVNAVASNTSMTVEQVKATEADTFTAEESLRLGLVDAIESPEEALEAFRRELTGNNRSFSMTTQTGKSAEAPATQAEETVSLAAHNQAVADAKAEGVREGENQMRERFATVLASEHYTGREAMALKLLEKDMSAEDICGVLEAAPVQAEAQTTSSDASAFAAAMDDSEHPNISAESDDAGAQEEDSVSRILGNYGKATGMKFD